MKLSRTEFYTAIFPFDIFENSFELFQKVQNCFQNFQTFSKISYVLCSFSTLIVKLLFVQNFWIFHLQTVTPVKFSPNRLRKPLSSNTLTNNKTETVSFDDLEQKSYSTSRRQQLFFLKYLAASPARATIPIWPVPTMSCFAPSS